MKSPVVDEDVGVAASIRIVNRHNLSREDLLRSGTATAEMLDWLSVFCAMGFPSAWREPPPPARPRRQAGC